MELKELCNVEGAKIVPNGCAISGFKIVSVAVPIPPKTRGEQVANKLIEYDDDDHQRICFCEHPQTSGFHARWGRFESAKECGALIRKWFASAIDAERDALKAEMKKEHGAIEGILQVYDNPNLSADVRARFARLQEL